MKKVAFWGEKNVIFFEKSGRGGSLSVFVVVGFNQHINSVELVFFAFFIPFAFANNPQQKRLPCRS